MRFFGRKEPSPSEAKTKLDGFNSRVARLRVNAYRTPRLRTAVLHTLPSELGNVATWCKIASKSGKYDSCINAAKANIEEAKSLLK